MTADLNKETPKQINLSSVDLFTNRESSLLEFQARVLEEVLDENNLLLERIKFLAILGSNMDEFFMVRFSGLRKQVESKIIERAVDGKTPQEILAELRKKSAEIYESALHTLIKTLLPKLEKQGVHILNYEKLTPIQKERIDQSFKEVIFPILTPLALDPGHPFPHISNLSLNFFIVIKDAKGREKFARLKIPDTLPRLLPIKRSSGGVRKDGTIPHNHYFVWLEQVIEKNLPLLFKGLDVAAVYPFRIVRDADLEIQELEADDLLENMQTSIRKRKFGSVVRVEVNNLMPQKIREILIDNLEVHPNDLFVMPEPFGLSALWKLYNQVERIDLKEVPYKPRIPKILKKGLLTGDIFSVIRNQNILLHHPYDSFDPVVDFLTAAARDPHVLAIKQTLYRVGQNSPVVEALLEAAERGKQVAVLVELKARFDEESNIGWALKLEEAGVHVVYGLVGLKTHSKIAMVIRQEEEGIRRYLHLATGNYNSSTAKIYEDIGMFTCDPVMGEEVSDLFNYLTGYATQQDYQKLLVAPVNLRQRLTALIQREVALAKVGKAGHIIMKVNSIVDPAMIIDLYKASQAGVKIDLFVRGMCCLKPGVEGVSENIRVTSIVGRFLEHSRVYYFGNDGKPEVYVGSADVMQRNLDHRVEVVFPVERLDHIKYFESFLLANYQKDNHRARVMHASGKYTRVKPEKGVAAFDIQQFLMENAP